MAGEMPNGEDIPRRRIEERLREPSEAIRLLGDVVRRANALFKPVPVDRKPSKEFGDPLEPYKIASICLPVFVNVLSGADQGVYPQRKRSSSDQDLILNLQSFDNFDLCVPAVPELPIFPQKDDLAAADRHLHLIEIWCDELTRRCESALNEGARYLITNELGYPNFWPGRPTSIDPFDVKRKLLRRQIDLDSRLQQLALDYNAIIIAGSYHDWTTFENVGHVYFPSTEHACNHKKLTSARGVGEHIKVARGNAYPVYNVGSAIFCVLICSDAFDLNIFFRQLCQGTNDPNILPQIFFVPSFYIREKDKRHALVDACHQLSIATGTSVVFTNHASDDQSTTVFIAGDRAEAQQRDGFSIVTIDPVEFRESYSRSEPIRSDLSFLRGRRTMWRSP